MSSSADAFIEMLLRSSLITRSQIEAIRRQLGDDQGALSSNSLVTHLADSGHLSDFQANEIRAGKIDNLVVGDYVILHPVGRGGMGEVFRARHSVMKREVAVKFTLPDESGRVNEAAIDRFQREVEAASKLTHPNIVNSLDAGRRGETCFLVMEYIQGLSLSQHVRVEGVMSWPAAVDVIIQVAEGLEFAHNQNVIHRDIKPGNLLITADQKVKILDMGLVRMKRSGQDLAPAEEVTEEHLTRSGLILGTVDFMSPEQAIDSGSADARSDIYSLGCTLFYLLTGRPPFRKKSTDSTMSRIIAHREAAIPSLRAIQSEVPDELQLIFEKMMAKRPEDRYQDANELIIELRRFRTGTVSDAETVADTAPDEAAIRGSFTARAGTILGCLIAASLAVFSVLPSEFWSDWTNTDALPKLDGPREAESDDASLPIESPVDLLAAVDFDADVVSGEGWWRGDGFVYVPPNTPSKLMLPVTLPESFQFDLRVKRVIASGPFVMGVNSGRCKCYVLVDLDRQHRGLHMAALGTIEGHLAEINRKGIELPLEEEIPIRLRVHEDGIELSSEGIDVIRWDGSPTQFGLGAGWSVGATPGLFIGSNGDAAFEISQLRVAPFTLLAKVGTEEPAVDNRPPKRPSRDASAGKESDRPLVPTPDESAPEVSLD